MPQGDDNLIGLALNYAWYMGLPYPASLLVVTNLLVGKRGKEIVGSKKLQIALPYQVG